jgi:hypothetical protein
MRRVALLTLLTFGCATVRPPERASSPPPVRRVALAEPSLELWVEGTKPVDPREKEAALTQSREALARALDGRGLAAENPDEVIVVRAREIARTGERKSAQTWSIVGMVVGFVAVIAAVVVLAKHGGDAPKSARSSKGAHAAVPAPRGGGARPIPRPGFVPAPAPPVNVFVGFNFVVPVGPYAPAPVPGVVSTDAWLGNRGWFAGDEVELTVEGTDPATGALRWRRVVKDGIDPRDGEAVARLVDRALAGVEWGPPEAPPPAFGDEPLPPVPPPTDEPPPPPPLPSADGVPAGSAPQS